MTAKASSSLRPFLGRTALIALGCALLAFVTVPAVNAADPAQPAAKAAPSLPLKATFEKVVTTEAGPPYVLHLQNEGKTALKVSGKVLLSVAFHSATKARTVPAQVIEPGKSGLIGELAAKDIVTLTADGYAPLELTVP